MSTENKERNSGSSIDYRLSKCLSNFRFTSEKQPKRDEHYSWESISFEAGAAKVGDCTPPNK